MNTFLEIVLVIVFLRSVYGYYFLLYALRWLKGEKGKKVLKVEGQKPQIYILIPALREQKVICSTLDYFFKYFSAPNVKVVVITTQREFEKQLDGPSTNQLVNDYIRKNNWQKQVICVDFPDKQGMMADQLNHYLDTLTDLDSFVTVYNADSRPHLNTLDHFYTDFNRNSESKVFQQSAIFLKNFDQFSKHGFISGGFLKASAVLQTRWTLAHEIPRILRQSSSGNEFNRTYAYAHVVGHGLIIQTGLLKKVGGFPSRTITEDLFLGYLLRSKGVTIYPLGLLELADSPKSVLGLLRQKYVWFFGPMKTFTYLAYTIKNRKALGVTNLLAPISFTIQGTISVLAWLFSGPMILLLLISPLLTESPFLIVGSYISVFTYAVLPFITVYVNFPLLYRLAGDNNPKLNFFDGLSVIMFSIPVILIHSVPPYFSLISEMKSKLTHTKIYKPKT